MLESMPRILITIGDPAGIGPEVIKLALASGNLPPGYDFEVIGDRTAGLKRGPDGSIDILICRDEPGVADRANWLPAPAGVFRVTSRAYLPRAELREGRATMPTVIRIPSSS